MNESTEAKTEQAGKKLTKVDIKRIQVYQERRKRLLNKGVDPSKVDQVLAEEDYRSLSPDKKIERLQMGISQAFQEFAKDINALQHNSNIISDVMDTNFRAFARCLEKAGVSMETQSAIIKDVETEIAADRMKRLEAAQKEAETQAKMREEQSVSEALQQAEGKPVPSEEQPAAPIPEGATTFGD